MAYRIYEDLNNATHVKIHLSSCGHYKKHLPTSTQNGTVPQVFRQRKLRLGKYQKNTIKVGDVQNAA